MQRDTPGFVEFYRAELGALVAFVQKAGYGLEEAKDSANEAMTYALQRWPDIFQSRRGWVRTAAHRLTRAHAQRSREEIRRAASGGWALAPHYDSDAAEAAEELALVLELLRELPAQQRLVMAWHLDGFSHKEISEHLQMREVTVRSTLRHARDRLKVSYCARTGGGRSAGEGEVAK